MRECWALSKLRELPPQDEINKPRDHLPIEPVPASTWRCKYCDDEDRPGADTTVDWLDIGRCRECGQKYELGLSSNPDFYPPLITPPTNGDS